MKRKCSLRATVLSLVLLAVFTMTAAAAPFSQHGYTCPFNCSCELSQIACKDWLPKVVSDTIEEVIVTYSPKQIKKLFYPGVFCNVTWNNVHKLTLTSTLHIRSEKYFALYKTVHDLFQCLEKILTLKLLNFVPSYSFSFLTNVTYLSISQSPIDSEIYGFVYFPNLSFVSDMKKIPKLIHFKYSWRRPGLLFNDEFIHGLCSRPIQTLDLTSTRITFSLSNSSNLCQTLTTLILPDSEITIKHLPLTCPPLQFVDLSGVNIYQHTFAYECNTYIMVFYWSCPFSAKVLHMNRMVASPLGKIYRICKVNFDVKLQEFHFTHNVLPSFEFSFTAKYLRYIKLSNNNIETLNPSVFTELPSLQKIDLSFNNLHLIGSLNNTVSSLFKQNFYLKIIDFSSNKLSFLPNDTFASNNNLEEILISNNSFTQLSFNISNLYNLTLLDLRFNDIQNFDSNSRQALYELQQQRLTNLTRNKSLQVLLEGNPFTCRCSDLDFLRWFAKFPMFDSRRQKYVSQLNDQTYTLNNEAVEAASDDCQKAARERRTILLSTIIPGISVIIVSLTIRTLYRRRKRMLLQEKLEDQVRLVQDNNTLFNFPVFLSYSSLDIEFVANHVRQPLQRHLQAITQVERDLVCDADIHFIPGHNIYQEMSRCIEESAVFVAVISENYCKSDHCQIEIAEARTTGKPILLIFKEHVPANKMGVVVRDIFRQFARVKFVKEDGTYRIQPSWEQICESIIRLQ